MADLTNLKPGDSVEVTVILTIDTIEHIGERQNGPHQGGSFTAITFKGVEGQPNGFTLELPSNDTPLAAVTVTAARP